MRCAFQVSSSDVLVQQPEQRTGFITVDVPLSRLYTVIEHCQASLNSMPTLNQNVHVLHMAQS